MKLVSIDAGMYQVKAKLSTDKGVLIKRSLIDYQENVPTDNGEVVSYLGKSYVIDDPSINCDYDFNKDREKTQILIYHAVSRLVNDGDTVNLVIGFPLSDWLNRQRRDQFKEMIMGDKLIALDVNRVKSTFIINDVLVLPETSGYIFSNMSDVKSSIIGVIDIGGANSQGCIYSNGKPIASRAFNSNKGMNYFISEARKSINGKFGTNYDEIMVEKLLDGECNHDMKDEILDEIRNIVNKYSKNIMTEIKATDWNIGDLDIILTGGGSKYFYDVLKGQIKHLKLSNSPISDNVEGFNIVGVSKYGKSSN